MNTITKDELEMLKDAHRNLSGLDFSDVVSPMLPALIAAAEEGLRLKARVRELEARWTLEGLANHFISMAAGVDGELAPTVKTAYEFGAAHLRQMDLPSALQPKEGE